MTTTINASTAAGGGLINSADASGILQLQTAGTAALTIDGSQNVGIGTASPQKILQVGGGTQSPLNGSTTAIFTANNSNSGRAANIVSAKTSGAVTVEGQFEADGANAVAIFGTSSNHNLNIRTNNNTVATFDTSGNVGIGTSSPGTALDVIRSSNNGGASLFPCLRVINSLGTQGDNSTTYNYARLDVKSGNGAVFGVVGTRYDTGYSGMFIGPESNHPVTFQTNGTERARIDTSGNLLVGTTSGAGLLTVQSVFDVQSNTNVRMRSVGTMHQISTSVTNSTSNTLIEFGRSATTLGNYTACGKLWLDGSGNFAAANSSDATLKENIVDLPNGLATVLALKPRQFDWIGDDDRKQVKGFVAQEVETVLPRSVGVDEKTGLKLVSLETEMFPVLVKAIQEQQALITTLTERISALEAK